MLEYLRSPLRSFFFICIILQINKNFFKFFLHLIFQNTSFEFQNKIFVYANVLLFKILQKEEVYFLWIFRTLLLRKPKRKGLLKKKKNLYIIYVCIFSLFSYSEMLGENYVAYIIFQKTVNIFWTQYFSFSKIILRLVP